MQIVKPRYSRMIGNKEKKRWATLLSLLMILLLMGLKNMAQDIHFSQFFEAPLLRNPSLAGIFTGDIRVQGVYRDQWKSFTNAYRSGSFNAEYKMPIGKADDFITAGLQILYDKAGSAGLTSTYVLPAINYHKSLSSEKVMYLSVGFMGGILQKRIDRTKITTNSQFDGTAYNPALADGETFINPNYTAPDGSFGASFNASFGQDQKHSFYLGAAYHHISRPRNSFYLSAAAALNPKYVFSAGVKYFIDDNTFFTLQADHSAQGSFQETIGGALYSVKMGGGPDNPLYTLHAGAFLRWKDAMIPVIKIDYNPFAVAISYDVNVSALKTVSQSRGGFELSVSYVGFLERSNSSKYKVLCPRF
ncbi:MAG: PorP/SprF family type IX secretion system membrane protein [Chitinophagaceae bacterium]